MFWLLVLVLVCAATWSNLDLTRYRAALFMDEMIPFDNVKRILTASSPKAFGWAICDGGDHRYGRISYNVSALTGWLPFRLAGDTELNYRGKADWVWISTNTRLPLDARARPSSPVSAPAWSARNAGAARKTSRFTASSSS